MSTPLSSGAESAPEPSPVSESATRVFPLRRLIVMATVVGVILLSVNAFVCATVGFFLGLPGWPLWQVIPAIVPLVFIAAMFLEFGYPNPLQRVIYAASAAWLGALNFAFFAAIACWILSLPDWLAGWPIPPSALVIILFGIALIVTIYGLVNAATLRTTRVDVRLPNLPPTWKGRTIALVTDLHLGRSAGPEFLRLIISRLRALQPDAVFISGDLFDGTTAKLDRLIAPWSDYSAPRGVFYVTGNHDEFSERTIYFNAVQRTGIRILHNEKIIVDGLQIVGVHDSEAGDATELRRILRHAQVDPNQPSILVAHRPENLAVVEEEGISLQLSGHTHKGQLWPWTLLVRRIYGPFAYGLHRLKNLQVYTSSGAGLWGPPLRVGTKSELVLIRLE